MDSVLGLVFNAVQTLQIVQLSIIQLQCRINTGHKLFGGQSAGVDLQCYSNPANFAVEHDHSQCGTWNRVIELVGLEGVDLTSGLDTGAPACGPRTPPSELMMASQPREVLQGAQVSGKMKMASRSVALAEDYRGLIMRECTTGQINTATFCFGNPRKAQNVSHDGE